MDIQRVGVVGAGTMGNGIAHVFARGGFDVVLCDVEQRFLERGAWDDQEKSGSRGREEQDHGGRQGRGAGAHSTGHGPRANLRIATL